MKTSVFIVTDGEYSDYSIRQVFLEKANAERYAAMIDGQVETYQTYDGTPCIELWGLNVLYNIYMDTGQLVPGEIRDYEVQRTNSIDWHDRHSEYGEVLAKNDTQRSYRYLKFRRSYLSMPDRARVYKAGVDLMWMAVKYRNDGFTIDQVNEMLFRHSNVDDTNS